MVQRNLQRHLLDVASRWPVVTLTGPRQSGKTTLAQMVFPGKPRRSLEALDVREFARTDPRGFLREVADGAILDEVQRVPELLSYLQEDVDARPEAGRFVLTGSANFQLLQNVSQSLAGRVAVSCLLPLARDEVMRFPQPPVDALQATWTGSYPAIFYRGIPPAEWFGEYVTTYVERDVRQVLKVGDLTAFQGFLKLVAGRTAQVLNLSGLASDCGITQPTARAWLSVLEASYLVHRLPALAPTVTRRVTKAPKVHFVDTGLACYLLGIETAEQLRRHPLRGALFESFVVGEILKARLNAGLPARLAHYRDHRGLEVDAVVEAGDRLLAVEVKSSETVPSDGAASLARFAAVLEGSGEHRSLERFLVFAGEAGQRRSDVTILPWHEVPAADWGRPVR